MSLINQVLNELEGRGALSPQAEGAIRAIPPRRQSHRLRNVLLAVLLALILSLVTKWYLERTETQPPEKPAVATVPVPAPLLAASAAISAPVAVPDADSLASLNMSQTLNVPPRRAVLHNKPLVGVASEQEQSMTPAARGGELNRPAQDVAQPERAAAGAAVDPQLKKINPQQQAVSEFQKANQALQENRINAALAGFERALLADPTYKPARQAWAGLLVSLKRNDEAERVLQRGLKRDAHDAGFSMMLARLQVERGDVATALATLQRALSHAEGLPEYRAFVAALLQRQSRHEEAVTHFQAALKLAPGNGIWLMGLGISLQALQHNEEARDAYQRALASNSLNAQLQAYVQDRLKEL